MRIDRRVLRARLRNFNHANLRMSGQHHDLRIRFVSFLPQVRGPFGGDQPESEVCPVRRSREFLGFCVNCVT
jgi:hypothetical protein